MEALTLKANTEEADGKSVLTKQDVVQEISKMEPAKETQQQYPSNIFQSTISTQASFLFGIVPKQTNTSNQGLFERPNIGTGEQSDEQ